MITFQNKKILAIGAHPDDIEIGCGGTLLKARNRYQAEVYLLVLTHGKIDGNTNQRLEEQKHAASILEASYEQKDLVDKEIQMAEAIACIKSAVDRFKPDYIFTHALDDIHQDHRTVAAATLSAHQQNIFYYRSYAARNFQPTVFVDITETLSAKLKLLDIYASQSHLNLHEVCKSRATEDAILMPYKACEGFQCDRLIL